MRILLLLLTVLTVRFSAIGEELNAVLATVNGNPVFLGDILPLTRTAEYKARAALKGKELEKHIKELRTQAVNDIIDRKLLLAAYEASPFKLPDGLVDQRLDAYAVQLGCNSRQEFAARLRKEKSSVDELRKIITEQLKAELTLYREIQPDIHVSPQEIYAYYQKNISMYCTAESFELALLLLEKETPAEKIEAIGRQLSQDPNSFPEMAKKYSKGPNAADGGKLGSIAGNLLRKEFAQVLTKPEIGKIYGPLPTTDGVVFLKLYGHDPEKKTPFAKAAPEIKKLLETQQRQKNVEKYLKKLRSYAVIRIFF